MRICYLSGTRFVKVRKYPKNPKHPGQKYMLTEKGKALLK